MKRFLKSLSLLLCSSLFAMTGWAETIAVNQETIGINFTASGKLMSVGSSDEYGYYSSEKNQGGLLAENQWQNFTELTQNQVYGIETVGNQSLSIQLKKFTNNSIWGPDASTNKLLGAYLDNASTLALSGLPTSGYDVAIIFAGDTDSLGACDKYSSVEVNGVSKTYNENGELVDGNSPWGNRVTTSDADMKQLTATGTSTTGQVMYLSGMTSSTLHIKTKSEKNNTVGRGTIAAIQIYLKPGTFEKTSAELPTPAWMWSGEGGTDSGETVYGTKLYTVEGKVINTTNAGLAIPANNFTFSYWSKMTNGATWRNYAGFSDTAGGLMIQKSGANSVNIYNSGSVGNISPSCGFTLSSNTPQLLTFVSRNGTLKVYVDGKYVSETTPTNWNSFSTSSPMTYFGLGIAPSTSGGSAGNGYISAYVGDARIYGEALSEEQVKLLYLSYLASYNSANYRTLSMDADTNDNGAISREELTTAVGEANQFCISGDVILNKGDGAQLAWDTLEVYAAKVPGYSLTIAGEDSLTANNTVISVDTTVEAGAATLGAVTLNDGYTLTVSNVNPAPYTSLAGAGTLNLNIGASTTLENYALNDFSGTTKISSGTLKYTAAANRPAGAILVSGENAALQIATNTDILGYSGGLPGITIKNGGRFKAFQRDTFSRVLTLNSGHLVFSADDQNSGRSFDLYNNSKIVSLGTSTIGGENATNDAESGDPIVSSGIIAIRRSNLEIEVADGTLSVYSAIKTEQNSGGSVYKKGAGTLAVYRAATSALPVIVEAGELRLVRKGSLTTGAMTVNDGATLRLADASTSAVTLASSATLAGTGTINGTLTFNAGATIDAIDGAITASDTVTLPADGTVTVTGVFGGNYILKTTSASAEDAAKFTVADGYEVVADDVGYKVVKVVTLEAGATYDVTKPLEYTKIVSTGAITINIADVTLDQAMVAPYLDVTGVTGGVTYELAYETFSGYTVDRINYPLVYRGTTDANWATLTNWYTGTRTNDTDTYWIPYTGTVVPGAEDSNEWRATLFDGNLIGNNIATINDYKTVTLPWDTTSGNKLEGWALKLRVSNGVHLKVANLKKMQSAANDNNGGMIYVDETSMLTISTLGSQGTNVFGGAITILGKLVVENNLTAKGNDDVRACFNYTLGKRGHVQYAGLETARDHVIESVTLNLGDSALTGKGIVERELVGFTSADANQTFTYEESGVSGVTNADESGTVTVTKKNSVAELSAIGDYCFVKRDNDGYYVVYMAYAETVELTEFTATVDAGGTTLSEALNGAVLSASAALTIDFGGTSGQTFIFDNEEALNFSSITVTGTNGGTIALGQTCAGITYDALTLNTVVSADAAFYAVNTGTIGGTGKLCLASGELTLTKANTYEGGTDIAADATLTVPTNGLGSGALTGAGKLIMPGYPANENVRTSLSAENWTGHYVNTANNTMADTGDWFGSVGNEGSSVEFTGSSTGYLAPAGSADFALIVSGSITFNNGNSSNGGYTFNGPLSGTGTIATTGQQSDVLQFVAENNDFRGTVTVDGYHCVAFGEQADDDSQQGKIVINQQGVTIASGKTWTAVNGITITENGTLTISEARALPTDKAVSGAGTLVINGTVDLSGITGALTCALTAADGATVTVTEAQLVAFAKITIPGTATLIVKVDRPMSDHLTGCSYDITAGAGSTIDGSITVNGIAGTGTFSNGTLSIVAPANPTLTGNAWWWDYEFNGSATSSGSDTASMKLESSGQKSYTDAVGGNQELYFQQTPWRNATFTTVDAFTAVMYCQPGDVNNTALVGFGSVGKYANSVAILLATGDNAANGAMKILLVKGKAGGGFDEISLADKLTVPNATKAKHLYAFTFNAQADKTVISVYVDGKLKKTTTVHERFHVQDGFQIGSAHGGLKQVDNLHGNISLTKYANSGDSGTIDFLRVTKGILSADAMRALAEAYPYHSEKGTATRTVADATANWVAESTWTQSGEDAPVNQPNDGTNVTLTANVETAVTVNLEEAVTYETVTVAGNAAVTFKKGEAATFKAGDITIGTDVTIEYGAIDVDTLIVNGGKTLTFDFTGYDFNSIYASKTLPLTGLATLGENADVEVALPTLPAYLTAECVFDANKSEYALAITVTGTLSATIENSEITWMIGNTVVTPPADLTALDSIPMTVVGANTLTLAADITMPSVTLTRSGEGVAAVTFENGKLTVNNTLTMNNVNVMATPDTLAAAVVMGTAGTESFTMHSRASYSHENKFAMRFENCAFTKDGVGTFPIASSGFVLDRVNVTLANGALQLVIGSGDPQIKDTTFTYVDANKDGVADGELTNHGWVRSTTTTTFVVPTGVTGKALVGSCLSNTGAVVKQGAGALELGVMKTANAGPYTGATMIEAGTLVYNVTNNTADALVMQGAITVKAGAAIKGVENCTLASLTFEAGAIVDATDSAVTATAVTLPETGTVKVRKTTHGDVLLTTGLDNVTKFVVEGEGRANWSLVVKENGLVYVAAPATGDVEFSAEVQEMLNAMAQAAAEYEGITSLTIEGVTLAMDGEGNPVKADIAGLELFESVPVLVVPDGENGTGVAMVNYVFGISDITVNGDGYIVVKASVDCLVMDNPVEPIEGEDAGEGEGEMPELPRPTFVNGVTVELLNNGESIGTETVDLDNMDNASEITITSTDDLVTIFKNGTGTLDLTVKATNVQTPDAGEGDEEEVTPAE